MDVVATAGHVDHGKSTLVRVLTGMEPDRWAEERRRGMTIDLGFAWTTLPSGRRVAFVDVPGHERFVPNMLAGVGPVPAALFVVAADEGWKPQSAEHLAALDALQVRHGLLVVTRSDLADPAAARAQARREMADTCLGTVESVAVSAATGAGLDELLAALDRLTAALPRPAAEAPVRLWVDRVFTVRGSGTVVTGTLPGGCIRVGDSLAVAGGSQPVRVRALQSLGEPVGEARAVGRVAVNLRGADRDELARGDALVEPGAWTDTDVIDVRLHRPRARELPQELVLHVGSAAVACRLRPFSDSTARVSLARTLPLHLDDRALLRDPARSSGLVGVTVLDVRPPQLRRRGAAAARAALLDEMDGRVSWRDEVRRRGVVRTSALRAMGVAYDGPDEHGFLVDDAVRERWRRRLRETVDAWAREHPLESGLPVDAARAAIGLPDRTLVGALLTPPYALRDGRVVRTDGDGELPHVVRAAVAAVVADLQAAPFVAPEAARLAELGLGARELAAAVRAGALLDVGGGIVLRPGADDEALAVLRRLDQPFTPSEARQALGTTRRVVVPLLEHLDRRRRTRRLADGRRAVL